MSATNLDRIGEVILARLEVKHAQREVVLEASRHLVQHAARAIRAIHRREWTEAEAILADAECVLNDMNRAAAAHADLASAGFTLDAQKEYAEARLTWALVRGEDLPLPEALTVDDAAWLNGLGEAAAELRRAALDVIRRGAVVEAEILLERMDDVYTFLTTIDFPSAITRDIKRTNDMVRGVVERTRGDLTLAVRQEDLQAALDRFERRVTVADET